jgi:predicted XRE-type DNA-binding protein
LAEGEGEIAMGVTHVTPAGGNVFADLGFAEPEAESLKIRSTLMIAIHRTIDERGLTKKDAARLFGVAQPRITALQRGTVGSFTIDEIVGMLAHAHIQVDVSVRTAA